MTPAKQVSPVIRISRGERDASARATHLEAATRKFLVTTNERKYMSTTTNFKRIALVAVAALGLGVLNSVPAQAQLLNTVALTGAAGTATTATSDSIGAATVAISFTSSGPSDFHGDSVAVTAVLKSSPTAATALQPTLMLVDTGTGNQFSTVDTDTTRSAVNTVAARYMNPSESVNAGSASFNQVFITKYDTSVVGSALANFKIYLDTNYPGPTATALVAGTYVVTVQATPYNDGVVDFTNTKSLDINIVVSAVASASTTASAANSTAYIAATRTAATAASTDSVITALATASTTLRASIAVKLRNASNGNAASESLTVTTNIGSVGTGAATGKSVTIPYTTAGSDTATFVDVYSDGTAGTATITIKSTSVTFASKTVVFYAAAPTTLVAKAINTAPGIGSTTAIAVDAKDANGNRWAGTLYTYSSATSTIANDGTATYGCSYVAARDRHECSVTGSAAGTATITVRDAATVATSTVASNAVSLTVTSNNPATVKLSFNKASYAPGEKATLTVSVLDSAGKAVSARQLTNLFATGGISSNVAAGNGSETTTAVSLTTASPQAADPTIAASDPVVNYTIYMPASGGTFTVTATGGTSLPLAGQVAVTASATVTDSAASALAAVSALATQVASLRTLITTLTNLVLKIQKKVKA
jgi:hypothetical protein